MATSLQVRPQNRDLGMVMREVDEDLAIFLGVRNGEERNELVQINNFEEFDASTIVGTEPKTNGLGDEAFQIVDDYNLLDFETGKNDHDWLYAQKDLDEEEDGAANQAEILNGECISLNSELLQPVNASVESAPAADTSSAAANKRPASSGGRKPASRAATPTRRPALPAKTKPSRASTPSRTTPASSKPVAAQGRSSTPSRATSSASSSKPGSRSSTPSRATSSASSSKTISRSSTPASRSSISKPASRSATPTRKTTTPSSAVTSKTRGGSQTVKSRPSNPTEMLSVSHDASQTLKKFLPRRPASASRGRPSAPAALSSSSKAKPRQKSCSPPRVRALISTIQRNGSTALSRSRGYGHGIDDDVNPVLMGTKMVERVVNMRKLAPPKQDDHVSLENPKKSSLDNSGFGRSLSKRSLDMAIRHMDIRRTVSGNLKPVATTSVLSYFSSGNQSSSSQSSSFGISESPITSSSDSSKSSNRGNSYFLDGRQMDD